MPRPESNDISEAIKPVKPAVPERSASGSSLGDTIRSTVRSYAHKAADLATGGALGTVQGARKNMNYYHEDDGK